MSRLAPKMGPGPVPVPRHVAFIMDGNRRWARAMGYGDVSAGHEFGSVSGEQVLEWCRAAKIHHVTVFVASLDNLRKRPAQEVQRLMGLIERFVEARLVQRDCHLHLAGHIDHLPRHTVAVLRHACEASAGFETDFHLTAAIAYDGHTEIVDAVRSWLGKEAKTGASLEQLAHKLSVEDISAHLYTNGQPCPELVIRTGGDFRLSCFMPWQTAYSHLYFLKAYWPAFTEAEFIRAMRWYGTLFLDQPSKIGRLANSGIRALRGLGRSLCDVTRLACKHRAFGRIPSLQRPKHVAIVVASDKLGSTNVFGASSVEGDNGVVSIRELLSWCAEFEIETVTLGLLAADQLVQPVQDVKRQLHHLVAALEDLSSSPIKPRLRLHGMLGLLPEPALSQLAAVAARTAGHTGMKTNLAICYDGRSEIVQAVRKVLAEHAKLGWSIDDMRNRLGTDDITKILCAPGDPDLDLIIFISSRHVLNGFLLWQAVRSEFWFWNDSFSRFRKTDFVDALHEYGSRTRRFGA